MRKIFIALIVVLLCIFLLTRYWHSRHRPISAPIATGVTWAKSYSSAKEESAYSIQQTGDGGYIVAGETRSFGDYNDFWVLKLNSDGIISWQKRYGGTGGNGARSIWQTSDGGYIVAGGTSSFGAGGFDFWVLKLNSEGEVSWQKTYGGENNDYARSIRQTSDGGYIVAGYTKSFGAGDWDFWVLKLNSEGGVSWQKTYGGADMEYAASIQQTSDGGYVVVGHTESFGAGYHDLWVLKLKSDGKVSWQKRYGGASNDWAYSIQQTSDDGYIMAGYTSSFGSGDMDFWVLKLKSDGKVSWQKIYGGASTESTPSIRQTGDGGYIMAGSTSFGVADFSFWVLKLNSDGSVSWQKTYGSREEKCAYSIRETSDGGYIVAGDTTSLGAGNSDFWVLKVASDGSIAFNPASGASMADTNTVPADTICTVADTTATVTDTSATITDTNATVTETNATVMQQAP